MIHPIPKPHPKSMSIQVLTSQNFPPKTPCWRWQRLNPKNSSSQNTLAKSAAFPATKRESGKCHCYWDGGQPKVYVPTMYYKIQLNGGDITHWSYRNQCNLNLSIFQWRQGSLVFGSTRPPKKGWLLSTHGVKWENFQYPGKPLKRARQIGQTLLCHEWLPEEDAFWIFFWFMKSGKKQPAKFLGFFSHWII